MTRPLAAFGTQEHLLVSRIALPRPALRALQISKTVLVDKTTLLCDGALLTGRLRIGCMVAVASESPAHPVEEVGVEHAFTLFLPIPGAAPDMELRVVEAHVAAGETTPAASNAAGRMVVLKDVSLLRLSAIVTHPAPSGVSRAPVGRRQ